MTKRYRSRLARLEKEKKTRSALFFFIFSLTLIGLAVILGIPFIIYLSSFLSELRVPQEVIQKGDEIPPQKPFFTTADTATFSAQLAIKGYTEAGATVVLQGDGLKRETVADNEGDFLFVNVPLKEGENRLFAKAIDQAGNESQKSEVLLITQDREPPELTITDGQDEAVVFEERLVLAGQTEKGTVLTINGQRVILDAEGKFNYSLLLSEGENQVVMIARDSAGNESKIEKKVEYKKE